MGVLLCGYLHCFKNIVLKKKKTSIESSVMLIHTIIPRFSNCFRIFSVISTSVTTPIYRLFTLGASDICLDWQDMNNKCAPPPPLFHRKKNLNIIMIICTVFSCCDAIGNILITSFWSHCRVHPFILWRRKLRNTYCTLHSTKACFRILS